MRASDAAFSSAILAYSSSDMVGIFGDIMEVLSLNYGDTYGELKVESSFSNISASY